MRKPYLLILAAGLLIAGALLVVRNHHTAATQAAAIVTADNAGSDTTTAIAALRQYAGAHTLVQTSFTLQAKYQRDTDTARAAATADSTNAQVYAAAQAACSGHTDSITQARCNQQYLAAHLVPSAGPATVTVPKLADYQYHIRGPVWPADAAGALLLGGLAALAAGLPWKRLQFWRRH